MYVPIYMYMYAGQVDELVRLCLGHLDITLYTSPRLLRQVLICLLNCIQNTDYITPSTPSTTNNSNNFTSTTTNYTTVSNNSDSNSKLYDICMRVITLLPLTPIIVQEVALSLLVTVIDKLQSASTSSSTSNNNNSTSNNSSINSNISNSNNNLMYMIYTHILPQLQHFIISLNIDLNRLISSSSTSSTHSSSNPVALWGQAIECVTRLGEYIVCYIL